ncbi:MAG: alanine dehydrogenase [Gammaproteobacteria bacterium]|nr:MAG: alanine dehydrogenase [Gammaproteobacteria bacterium]
MKIAVPREIKTLEGRVGLIPAACAELIGQGHEVYVEAGAGLLSGYSDDDYRKVGATVLPTAEETYATGKLIVKVKEPVAGDLPYLRDDHLLFCFLHLAAEKNLAKRLCDIGCTAVAFETVTDVHGRLPLLTPMSEIAGRLSVQIGAHLLHQPQGGRGVLLGGLPLTERGKVVILGAGRAGSAAALMASGIGAEVVVFDKNRDRLEEMHRAASNISALYPYEHSVAQAVAEADLVVGAVLLPGLHAPRLVTTEMVKSMQQGSVIVDISIDQGGCVETMRPTTYADPTYVEYCVTHFGVTNMPGAVPRTSSQALSAVITPYAQRLTQSGWDQAEDLRNGINVRNGRIDNPWIAEALHQV